LSYSFNETGFNNIQTWLSDPVVKVLVWLALIPYFFHLVAGIRHLLSDIHIGDTLTVGRLTALLTFIISAVLIALAGVWLW
jgi:succinate dehydrogenase / fumarate reductase, cytochrome b subunit